MRTQEIWGNFPLGYWKCYGLRGCCAPQETAVAFVEPHLGALFIHTALSFLKLDTFGFFFSYTKWNKPVKYIFFFEEQCPVQYLRGWLWGKFQLICFWLRLENSDILVTRLLWHQSSEAVTVFVASLLSFTLNNLYPAYTCQTSAPITFLCVILKISQFLTLEWVAENLAGSVSVLTLG